MTTINEPTYTIDGWPVKVISFGMQDWMEFAGIDVRSPTFVYLVGDPEGCDEWLPIGVGDEVSQEIAERSIRTYPGGNDRLRTLVPYIGEPWEDIQDGDDMAFHIILIQRRSDMRMKADLYNDLYLLPAAGLRVLRDAEIQQIANEALRDL